jgi:hypothetical protein
MRYYLLYTNKNSQFLNLKYHNEFYLVLLTQTYLFIFSIHLQTLFLFYSLSQIYYINKFFITLVLNL